MVIREFEKFSYALICALSYSIHHTVLRPVRSFFAKPNDFLSNRQGCANSISFFLRLSLYGVILIGLSLSQTNWHQNFRNVFKLAYRISLKASLSSRFRLHHGVSSGVGLAVLHCVFCLTICVYPQGNTVAHGIIKI